MSKFKYIILELPTGIEAPILFSKFIEHAQLVANVKPTGKVVSAGFVSFDGNPDKPFQAGFTCYGKSVSLDLHSRPEDSKIIQKDYEFSV